MILQWESIDSVLVGYSELGELKIDCVLNPLGSYKRTKVPGGWFVLWHLADRPHFSGMIYYPDPEHKWDGNSVPLPENIYDDESEAE
jgi:hypothetical protein